MKALSRLKKKKFFKPPAVFIVCGVFVIFGLATLLISNAASNDFSIEAETATLTGNVTSVNDTLASGGAAIKFQSTTAPPVLTNRPAQSAAIVYNSDMTNVSAYAKPGGLVVAGRDNYQNQAFKNVSAAGGTVLIYLDMMIVSNYGTYQSLLINSSVCGAAVPSWPGNPQANQWGNLSDFRVGGILQNKLECVLEKMVADNPHMGGWFADDLGSRSWFPDFNWDAWSTADKQAYRDGAIAASQTFRKVANKYGLIFIVNGTWGSGTISSGGGYPDMSKHGNALADGGFVENHDASQLPYFGPYSCSTQWAAQSPVTRGTAFNYAVTKNNTDRDAYINSNCYAFVANQPDYGLAPVPWSTLHPTGLPSKVGGPVSF